MNIGHFYFLSDEYFQRFKDSYLMNNKEAVNGKLHARPCFYAFQDRNTKLYWLIPFSSQLLKYRKIYDQKINKYEFCDTIIFGEVLGYEKAFLIQNMCPCTKNYISSEYVTGGNNLSVRVKLTFEEELQSKASKVLQLVRQGERLIFPNVLKIERELLADIHNYKGL